MASPARLRQDVQKHYGEVARARPSCCTPQNTLYPEEALRGLPAEISGFSAGNGDPITPARLEPGETVLDLGSGGGLDCFLAARAVGENGRVIGVDMTPEMLARARSSAARLGIGNVEFREGYLESLPVEDASVDVVVSNCVVNLSPDKPRVFREAFRVLKPGGRISFADSVTNHPVPAELRENREEWCGCVSGALSYAQYVAELARAGFVEIELRPVPQAALADALSDWESADRSVFLPHLISARKPE